MLDTWRKAQRLQVVGTLLAHGRRTVTTALRHTGQGDTPSFSLYHQVFNRASAGPLSAPGSRCLLSMLVQTFDAAGGSLTFVIDETVGATLHGADDHRQQARSLPRPAGFQPQAHRQHQCRRQMRLWPQWIVLSPGHHATLE